MSQPGVPIVRDLHHQSGFSCHDAMSGSVARVAVVAVFVLVCIAFVFRTQTPLLGSTPAPAPSGDHPVQSGKGAPAAFVKAHRVNELFGGLWDEMLEVKPADPVAFLQQKVRALSAPKLVIVGAPASGKGTQCEMIIESLGVVHISTGDLLREEMRRGTETGKQAHGFMKAGKLVPDELVVGLVRKRLAERDVSEKGWLLDGFPRTVPQAEIMEREGLASGRFPEDSAAGGDY
eukprot:Hpha_TRINITY_DN16598_c1_g5::TRINITY_DN16598_c1_g5_i1::g.132907::m.132907/K00939/adk, AK; adenylate kinase